MRLNTHGAAASSQWACAPRHTRATGSHHVSLWPPRAKAGREEKEKKGQERVTLPATTTMTLHHSQTYSASPRQSHGAAYYLIINTRNPRLGLRNLWCLTNALLISVQKHKHHWTKVVQNWELWPALDDPKTTCYYTLNVSCMALSFKRRPTASSSCLSPASHLGPAPASQQHPYSNLDTTRLHHVPQGMTWQRLPDPWSGNHNPKHSGVDTPVTYDR